MCLHWPFRGQTKQIHTSNTEGQRQIKKKKTDRENERDREKTMLIDAV